MSLENASKNIHNIKTQIKKRRRQGRGQRGKELKIAFTIELAASVAALLAP